MIHVAIISHGHEELLIASALGGLLHSDQTMKVWLKDNKPSSKLKAYCAEHAIFYTDAQPGLGFGHNNNFLFDLIRKEIGFAAGDTFIAMNPDITITPSTTAQLVAQMKSDNAAIATINLYRDKDFSTPDANVRRFPNLFSFFKILLLRSVSQAYEKNNIPEPCQVDWASGAFLAFDAAHYATLKGFDLRYFMYFEDVDICYRSTLLGKAVQYYPQFKAIHAAAHKNRNIVSKHAVWFFHSFIQFLTRRYLYSQNRRLNNHVK